MNRHECDHEVATQRENIVAEGARPVKSRDCELNATYFS